MVNDTKTMVQCERGQVFPDLLELIIIIKESGISKRKFVKQE